MLSHIITSNSITILINNKPEIVDSSHPNFQAVEDGLKSGKSETQILELMNVGKAVTNFADATEATKGKVKIKDGEIFYMDEAVHSALSTRILSLMENGFDITPFTNFMENLYQNPSHRAVNETYGFLEACNLPITEDGHFLAYKKITKDYLDCYTKTIDNSIGAKPEMPRYKVNEDKNQTCSTGLHVASYSYMKSYSGDRIVICKVNPKDVVSVPTDYNNAKMRVCKYEVINEVDIKDEEITPNVISDDEAYHTDLKEAKGYDSIEQALMSVRQDSFSEIKKELEATEVGVIDYFKVEFAKIDNRTKNWRNILLDTFSPKIDKVDETPEVETNDANIQDIQDIQDRIDSYDYYDLLEIYSDCPPAADFLDNVTVNTSFWKRDLALIVAEYEGLETPELPEVQETHKKKFSEIMKEYLGTFEYHKWNKLSAYLLTKGVNIGPLLQTSLELKDEKVIVNKLKSLAKEGKIKKSKLIKKLV